MHLPERTTEIESAEHVESRFQDAARRLGHAVCPPPTVPGGGADELGSTMSTKSGSISIPRRQEVQPASGHSESHIPA